MCNVGEISDAVKTARDNGCQDLVLLHCVSSYPAATEDSNVRTVPQLAEAFNCVTGLSDHAFSSAAAIASIALALGKVSYDLLGSERGSVVFRRSLYVVEDIPKCSALTGVNVRSIRPGYGLAPKHLPDVLSKGAVRDLKRGERLSWGMLVS
jgi:N-acetylneuraminate synthase